MKRIFCLSVLGIFFGNAECFAQGRFHGYDLEHPSQTISLPESVNEISGISYQGNAVFAINDEEGSLYKIELKKDPAVKNWSFGSAGDYEDIALVNQQFYILKSNGQIVQFAENFPIEKTAEKKLENKGRNEYESLYYDPAIKKLVVLCKQCSGDKKDENSAWSYDPSSQTFNEQPLYVLNKKDIEKVAGKKIKRFQPSAAAVHPLTKEVYILSSVNKLLVVMKDNVVKDAIELNSDLFKQPEGITFSPSGKLYISNEAGGKGDATILEFEQHQ